MAHYAAVKFVMLTFASVPDQNVSQTVAYAIANDAWARELGPKHVTQQTVIADATQDYTYATVDAIREAAEAYLDAKQAFAVATNADEKTAATDRAGSIQDAIQANAKARSDFDTTHNDAGKTYSLKIAELRRDAQVAAGYYGDPTPDATEMAAAATTQSDVLQNASELLAAALRTAVTDYFTAGNEQAQQVQVNAAENRYDYSTDVADAVRDLDKAFNDAYRDYAQAVIDANADYAIAEVDANITWLHAVGEAQTNHWTTAAHAAAVANRTALVAGINADRAAALAAAQANHATQVSEIDDAHAEALAKDAKLGPRKLGPPTFLEWRIGAARFSAERSGSPAVQVGRMCQSAIRSLEHSGIKILTARIETTKLVGRELALIAFCLLCMALNAHAASKSFDMATFVHVPVSEAALHDAVWSGRNLCAPGSPRPVSGSGVGG